MISISYEPILELLAAVLQNLVGRLFPRDILLNVWYWNTFLKSGRVFLSLDHKFWWHRDGPNEKDLYFMMDWDRMKESVCRTPLDFMFTDIITIWQKSKIVKYKMIRNAFMPTMNHDQSFLDRKRPKYTIKPYTYDRWY